MDVFVTEKLVNITDGTILGYLVSAGGLYKVSVTSDFGKAHDVQDIDIADYLDVPVIEVVPVGKTEYAVVMSHVAYLDYLADTPVDRVNGNRVCYGYVFQEQNIVPLNSQAAFDRMIAEAQGALVE